MARSEFRYNKKRKHYSYIFKDLGIYRKNIVLSSKEFRKWKGKYKRNIKLFAHPNPNSAKEVFLIPIIYIDHCTVFDGKKLKWKFDRNDKRKVKRIIKKIKIKKVGIELTSIKTGISTD